MDTQSGFAIQTPKFLTHGGAHAETSGLDEPLLSTSDGEVGTPRHGHRDAYGAERKSSGGSAMVPYSINAYDWADLLRSLAAGAASGLRSLKGETYEVARWGDGTPHPLNLQITSGRRRLTS